jgi:hypothetical protein
VNYIKSTPLIIELGRKICPVCGKSSYSRYGIHPQCAMRQRDALRRSQLPSPPKPAAKPLAIADANHWRKVCPVCRRSLHVKKATCVCGHGFELPGKVATVAADRHRRKFHAD